MCFYCCYVLVRFVILYVVCVRLACLTSLFVMLVVNVGGNYCIVVVVFVI